MTRVLLIIAAVCLGVAGAVQLLASPKAADLVGFHRAYEPLPAGVVADLASGYQQTATRYDELAATAEDESFDTDAMRALATGERRKARAAQAELVIRWVGRGGQYAGLGFLVLAGLTWWTGGRRAKKHKARISAEADRDPDD